MNIEIFEINQVPEEWKDENRVLIYCHGQWLSCKWMKSKRLGWSWVCQSSGRTLNNPTHAMLPPNPNLGCEDMVERWMVSYDALYLKEPRYYYFDNEDDAWTEYKAISLGWTEFPTKPKKVMVSKTCL